MITGRTFIVPMVYWFQEEAQEASKRRLQLLRMALETRVVLILLANSVAVTMDGAEILACAAIRIGLAYSVPMESLHPQVEDPAGDLVQKDVGYSRNVSTRIKLR
jgi:hypothetical protein